MTVWHYKAEFVAERDGRWEYRYYPDHVMAPGVSGVFAVDLVDWEWENVEPARAEVLGLVSTDELCISALVSKIMKHAAVGPPESVFFVA